MSEVERSRLVNDNTLPMLLTDVTPDCPMVIERMRNTIPNKPPAGLWYQVNRDWERWVLDSSPHWMRPYRAIFKVDTSRFAVLRTEEDILEFFARFGYVEFRVMGCIRWLDVMREYDGIELPDFDYGWGLGGPAELQWTYGWDCSSGVTWVPSKTVLPISIERVEFDLQYDLTDGQNS